MLRPSSIDNSIGADNRRGDVFGLDMFDEIGYSIGVRWRHVFLGSSGVLFSHQPPSVRPTGWDSSAVRGRTVFGYSPSGPGYPCPMHQGIWPITAIITGRQGLAVSKMKVHPDRSRCQLSGAKCQGASANHSPVAVACWITEKNYNSKAHPGMLLKTKKSRCQLSGAKCEASGATSERFAVLYQREKCKS